MQFCVHIMLLAFLKGEKQQKGNKNFLCSILVEDCRVCCDLVPPDKNVDMLKL